MKNLLKRISLDKKIEFIKKCGYKNYNIIINNNTGETANVWVHFNEDLEEIISDREELFAHSLDEIFETCVINLIIDKLV